MFVKTEDSKSSVFFVCVYEYNNPRTAKHTTPNKPLSLIDNRGLPRIKREPRWIVRSVHPPGLSIAGSQTTLIATRPRYSQPSISPSILISIFS